MPHDPELAAETHSSVFCLFQGARLLAVKEVIKKW